MVAVAVEQPRRLAIGAHRDGGFDDVLVVLEAHAIVVSPQPPLSVAALAAPFSIAGNVTAGTGISEQDTPLLFGARSAQPTFDA